jgi:hypothetical protein
MGSDYSFAGYDDNEGGSTTLDIPGGTKIIQEYYRQMRKFGCNILPVVQQQYDIFKDSAVSGATIDNSDELLELNRNTFLEGTLSTSND